MGSFILFLLVISSNLFIPSGATDTITPSQSLTEGNALISAGGFFELGFFTYPPSSSFLGIWYHDIPDRQIVWVANRWSPVTGPNATLSLTPDGNLLISLAPGGAVWATNTSGIKRPFLQLLDSGNLVLSDGESNSTVWQSFYDPSDAFLPGMELGLDLTRKLDKRLMSWSSAGDPTPGVFTYGVRHTESSELVIWNGSSIEYRTGPWAGASWSGMMVITRQREISFGNWRLMEQRRRRTPKRTK